ncbi:MAG TPA: hypothetical protein VG266_03800 [Candidatus Dormibacteraeota bacterium]|nr:hypothetical protein [Candidatus Dormibacteraeota bacterium]
MFVHLHETIDVVTGKLADYISAIETVLMPLCDERKLRLSGFFQTAGSSGRWPEMIALWELDIDDHLAQRRTIGSHPGMREWMIRGAQLRRGGFDRMLLSHSFSPRPPVRPEFKAPGSVYLEQIFEVRPGATARFLEVAETTLLPRSHEAELAIEGFWRSEFQPLEHVALWSMPDWDAYGRLLGRRDPRDEASNLPGLDAAWETLIGLRERILIPLAVSPLGGGDQASTYPA